MGRDYSDIAFKDDGSLKLLIIVGTRPEVIPLSEVIKKCRRHFDCLLAIPGRTMTTLNGIFFRDLSLDDPDVYLDAVGADLGETVGNIIAASYKLMVQVEARRPQSWATPTAACPPSRPSACTSPSSTWRRATAARTSACPRRPSRRIVDVISDVSLAYSGHARRYLGTPAAPPGAHHVTGSPMGGRSSRANLDKIRGPRISFRSSAWAQALHAPLGAPAENIDTEANFTSLFTAINALAEVRQCRSLSSCHPALPQAPGGHRLPARPARVHATAYGLPRLQLPADERLRGGVRLRHPARGVQLLRERRQAFPGGVHPHLDRAPEALDKACFTLAGISGEGPVAGRPYGRRARRGRVAARGTRCPTTPTRPCPPKVVKIIHVFSQSLAFVKSTPFFRVSPRKFFGIGRGHAPIFLTCPA